MVPDAEPGEPDGFRVSYPSFLANDVETMGRMAEVYGGEYLGMLACRGTLHLVIRAGRRDGEGGQGEGLGVRGVAA